jgi:hypothetical protein
VQLSFHKIECCGFIEMNLGPIECAGMLVLYQLVLVQNLNCWQLCMFPLVEEGCGLQVYCASKGVRYSVPIHEISIQPKNPTIMLVFLLARHKPHIYAFGLGFISSLFQFIWD